MNFSYTNNPLLEKQVAKLIRMLNIIFKTLKKINNNIRFLQAKNTNDSLKQLDNLLII